MSRHKKQHYVAASYLKAWCDHTTPKDQTPYVWVFDKDGGNPRPKAPKNIFHETDMYTIQTNGGDRDITLEQGLQKLESEFTCIRDQKLKLRRMINDKEHVLLCAFIAAAQFRTPASREHHRGQWGNVLRTADSMIEWAKTATLEQKRKAAAMSASRSSNRNRSLSYTEVKALHGTPLQKMLASVIRTVTPKLIKLDMAIFETEDEIGFITSDNPCVWFDPEAYRRPPIYRQPALRYETVQITLPISPRQCALLNRTGIQGYVPANEHMVDEFNRRTRFGADKFFVVNRNETKAIWFDPGVEPKDSWDKLHSGKNDEQENDC